MNSLELGSDDCTWLLRIALENGYGAIAKPLLNSGRADANALRADDDIPLLYAVKNHNAGVVQALIDSGDIDVNAVDGSGRSTLCLAVENGDQATVKILLAPGKVDVARDKGTLGWKPRVMAYRKGNRAIISMVEAYGRERGD